jgi:hypothetical protein
VNDTELEEVLRLQIDLLTEAEKARMEVPLTLKELFAAAKCLANLKCPGPDGIPLEFSILNWSSVGPLLHQAILKGIEEGSLHEDFTKGYIVLLCKKGDQQYFSNKRPLTMLNVCYKIAAKAYQLRLVPILQRYITPQQVACLPGRGIHHALLLLSETLHHAEISELDHILVKLDIAKAFDMLEWHFLTKLLRKIGFGDVFIIFIDSTHSTAQSAVRINGRLSKYFKNEQSVRQGCPL